MIEEKQMKGEGQSLAGAKGSHVVLKPPTNTLPLLFTFPARKEKPKLFSMLICKRTPVQRPPHPEKLLSSAIPSPGTHLNY